MKRVHQMTCTVIGATFALTAFLVVHSAFAGPPVGRFVELVPIPGPDLNLPGVVDGAVNVSRDGMTLFFVSNRAGGEGNIDIYQATRDSLEEPFGNVVNLGAPINTPYLEQEPAISADGLTLYFRREDGTGGGSSDIYQATRTATDAQFGNVMKLEGGINSEFADDSPAISSDGFTFYFTSTRPGGLGGRDIYQATRTDLNEPFGNVTRLGSAINTNYGEFGPNLSSDGKTLFIWSDRPGGDDNFPTIWVSTRVMTDEPFGAPVLLNDFSLGSDFDSPTAWEASPSISSDWPDIGAKLYFARITGPGEVGLYQATWVPELAADFDRDGDVDGEDFLAWQSGFGIPSGAQKSEGDYDNDGDVDGQDFLGWQAEFGSGSGAASAAVPEPTSAFLLLGVALFGSCARRRRVR